MWSIDILKLITWVIGCVLILISLIFIGVTVHSMMQFDLLPDIMLPEVNRSPAIAVAMCSLVIIFVTTCVSGTVLENRTILYAGAALMALVFITSIGLTSALIIIFDDPSKYFQQQSNLKTESPRFGLINAQQHLKCCGYAGPEDYDKIHATCCASKLFNCSVTSKDLHTDACLPKLHDAFYVIGNRMLALSFIIMYIEIVHITMVIILCEELKKEDAEIEAEIGEDYWIVYKKPKISVKRKRNTSVDETARKQSTESKNSTSVPPIESTLHDSREDKTLRNSQLEERSRKSSWGERRSIKTLPSAPIRRSKDKKPSSELIQKKFDDFKLVVAGKDTPHKPLILKKEIPEKGPSEHESSGTKEVLGKESLEERPSKRGREKAEEKPNIQKRSRKQTWKLRGSSGEGMSSNNSRKSKEEKTTTRRKKNAEKRSSKRSGNNKEGRS